MTRNIVIEPVLNGYIVACGCQRVVFDSQAKLIAALSEYLTNPEKVESAYIKNAVNQPSNLVPTQPSLNQPPAIGHPSNEGGCAARVQSF